MNLSVITSYSNRSENLGKYVESYLKADRKDIEFWLIEYGDSSAREVINHGIGYYHLPNNGKLFSTAKCHNAGVLAASSRWILKQDVDCVVPDAYFYQRLIEHLKNKPWTYFMNIGVKNYLHGQNAFGNEWVCSKQAFMLIGGEPEFEGYGWEDYVFLYKLAKLRDRSFSLQFTENNVTDVIRDQLARVKNKETEFYMLHNQHRRIGNPYMRAAAENKKKAWQICKIIK